MPTAQPHHLDLLRWELDKLVARRLATELTDVERRRYDELCLEERDRLRLEYGDR